MNIYNADFKLVFITLSLKENEHICIEEGSFIGICISYFAARKNGNFRMAKSEIAARQNWKCLVQQNERKKYEFQELFSKTNSDPIRR